MSIYKGNKPKDEQGVLAKSFDKEIKEIENGKTKAVEENEVLDKKITSADDIEKIVSQYLISDKSGSMAKHIYRLRADWKLILADENSEHVKTACIGKGAGGSSIVQFNAGFLRKHVADSEGLVFVFLHELMHAISGDLVRGHEYFSDYKKQMANVVQDIKINSSLLRCHFKKGYQFLMDFYAPSKTAIGLILCPPFTQNDVESGEIFKPDFPAKVAAKAAKRRINDRNNVNSMVELGKWYADAWLKDLPVNNLLERLMKIFKDSNGGMQDIILLGSHGNGAGKSDDNQEEFQVDDFGETDKNNEREVATAIQKSLEQDGDNACSINTIMTMTGLVPFPGRRETFMLSAGMNPIFYKNNMEAMGIDYRKLNMYVDTSGSAMDELPFIYKLVGNVKNYLSDPIYLFSGTIRPISVSDFLTGKAKTNYGTNFNLIFRHAFEKGFQKILIITDGEDFIDQIIIETIKSRRLEVYVLLTKQDNEYSTILNQVAKKIWVLRRSDS